MDQRLNVITLGWQVAFTDGDIVMFQAGPMIVSLWSAAKLADDSGIDAAPDGWGGFTLGYAVGGPEEVDALCAEAVQAGATLTRVPVDKGFGYSGVFADADGHTWEIACKTLTRHADGTVSLPA
jgi:uncharacterized glyoxalase superfamily protein PhnB